MLRTIALSAAALAFTTPAFAGTFKVQTVNTFESTKQIVADKGVWVCKGNTCTAELKRSKVTVRGCRKAAKKLGEFVSYGSGENKLDDESLAVCNEVTR